MKPHRKTEMKKKNRQSENEEFESFKRVIHLLLLTFFEIFFFKRGVTLMRNKILLQNFVP